jgi:4a-hydroxytetrahydrobiopterin dehydratase
MERIPINELEQQLSQMKHWFIEGDTITKNYVFANFKEAIEFVNKVAEIAEEKNHHPDIKIFNYRNVTINLSTHSAGGVTIKDLEMAKQIDLLH